MLASSSLGLAQPSSKPVPPPSAAGDLAAVSAEPIMPTLPTLPTLPTRWLASHGQECIARGPFRGFCQGPRRAPLPQGPDAERAKALGIGDHRAAVSILLDAPHAEWVEAARAADGGGASASAEHRRDQSLHWPIEHSRILRGVGNPAGQHPRSARRVRPSKHPRARRRHPHEGVDIGATLGAHIMAVQSGLVIYSDNNVRGYGNLLIVVHADASVAMYAHCRAIYVFAGQRVKQGQVIAEVGETGYARGPHLHFEYRIGGTPQNPLPLFDHVPSARDSVSAHEGEDASNALSASPNEE